LAFIVGMVAVPLWGCGREADPASDSGVGGGLCGVHDSFGPTLQVSSDAPYDHWGTYDGPAVVGISTSSNLWLFFELSADADAGTPGPHGARLSGLDPMPVFPVGGKVWLSKDPVGDPYNSPLYGGWGWALSLRDREGGHLLLGAAFRIGGPAAPIAWSPPTDVCAVDNSQCPGRGSQVFYQAVEVHGDSTVTIENGHTATMQLDGLDYEVRVAANRVTSPLPGKSCDLPDYVPENEGGVFVDVRAKDLSTLIDGLERADAGP
jgi:hypothetical protein